MINRIKKTIGSPFLCLLLAYLWASMPLLLAQIQEQTIGKTEGDLVFFPEGGSLIPGVRCAVAFKNLSEHKLSGYITDESRDTLTALAFFNQKLGLFQLVPEAGKKYYAVYQGPDSLLKKTALPPVKNDAYALQVTQTDHKIFITWHTAPANSTKDLGTSFRLIVHTGDHIYYQQKWNPSKNPVVLNKKDFLSGILHIKLMDDQMNLLSERPLVCINPGQVQFSYTALPSRNRKSTRLRLQLVSAGGKALSGQFSIYITPDTSLCRNQLYMIYPSDDLEESLKLIAPDFQAQIRNKHLYDLFVLARLSDEEIRTVELEEVEITARQQVKKRDDLYTRFADYELTAAQIKEMNPASMESLIRRIPGLTIRNGKIILQRTQGEVAIHLDGTELSGGTSGTSTINERVNDDDVSRTLQKIDVNDIAGIQLIKGGASRSIFGGKGFNGILSIRTKQRNEPASLPPQRNIPAEKLFSRYAASSLEEVLYVNLNQQTTPEGTLEMDIRPPSSFSNCQIRISGCTDEGIWISGTVGIALP